MLLSIFFQTHNSFPLVYVFTVEIVYLHNCTTILLLLEGTKYVVWFRLSYKISPVLKNHPFKLFVAVDASSSCVLLLSSLT